MGQGHVRAEGIYVFIHMGIYVLYIYLRRDHRGISMGFMQARDSGFERQRGLLLGNANKRNLTLEYKSAETLMCETQRIMGFLQMPLGESNKSDTTSLGVVCRRAWTASQSPEETTFVRKGSTPRSTQYQSLVMAFGQQS